MRNIFLLLLCSLNIYAVTAQKADTIKYEIITSDKVAFYHVYGIPDTAIEAAINRFLYVYTYIDTTEKGSIAGSKIIYNRNGFLTVYREGNYDYWQDSTWIGSYAETVTVKTRTGDPVHYDDLFKRKDTAAIRNLVWAKAVSEDLYFDSKNAIYRITEDEFRISNEGVYFEIGRNCGRGPCLEVEQPVIIPFGEMKRYFKKGVVMK
jgi:hypothetical protein